MDLPGNVRRYRFGLFEVDPVRGELLRQGVRVKLQEQPFRLLILLLERAGEIVGRDELRTRLWPEDTFVEFDNSLNVAVRKLREALRDDANEPRFIETVPRRGYRLLAPVSLPEEAQIPVVPAEPRDAAPFHTADTSRVTVAPASDQRRRSPTRRYSWAFAGWGGLVAFLLSTPFSSRNHSERHDCRCRLCEYHGGSRFRRFAKARVGCRLAPVAVSQRGTPPSHRGHPPTDGTRSG